MIKLRKFTYDDISIIQDNMYPDMSESDIMNMIDEWNKCLFNGRFFEMFAIVYENKVVGSVSIYEQRKSVVSFGAEVFPEERNKGFAYVALSSLIKYASKKGYHITHNQVRTDNEASIRLCKKLKLETDGYVYRNQRNKEVYLFIKLI